MQTIKFTALMSLALLVLTGCSFGRHSKPQDGPPAHKVDVSRIPNAVPKPLPRSAYGNPPSYTALGKRYWVLPSATNYNKTGIASWYGKKFHGRLTSSREPYSMYAMTAASPDLPLPTFVRVTNLSNGRQIVVKVNDRGPFAPNRIIDLSYVAAIKLGMIKTGTAMVRVTAIDPTHQANTATTTAALPPTKQPKIYLQLGAFQQPDNAKQLLQQLQQTLNIPAEISTSNKHTKPLHRVNIGPLETIEQSDQIIKKISTLGYTSEINIVS